MRQAILIAALVALLGACAIEPFRDDRFFNTRDVFAKHENNLHLGETP